MRFVVDFNAYVPERGHDGDAGLDIRTPRRSVIHPHDFDVIDTGIKVEIPFGFVGLLKSKSGLMVNSNVETAGGVIDYGYTGTIKVKMWNHSGETFIFDRGDKIVQLLIVPCDLSEPVLVDKLKETERGDHGFGSTGK